MDAKEQEQSKAFVDKAVKWIDDKQGINTKVIDVKDHSILADYLIITGGSSERQVAAIADNIEYEAKKIDMIPKGIEGERGARWILLDYYDVIIHVFHEKEREFYDLERLLKDSRSESSDDENKNLTPYPSV